MRAKGGRPAKQRRSSPDWELGNFRSGQWHEMRPTCELHVWNLSSRGTSTLARDYVSPLPSRGSVQEPRFSQLGSRKRSQRATEDGLGPDGRHGLSTPDFSALARRVQLNIASTTDN